MKEENVQIVFGLIGIAIIGFLGIKSSNKKGQGLSERSEKLVNGGEKEKIYKDPPFPGTANEEKYIKIIREILKSRDFNIRTEKIFLSKFVRVLITKYCDRQEIMEEAPKNVEELEKLVDKFGLTRDFKVKLYYNNGIYASKTAKRYPSSPEIIRKKRNIGKKLVLSSQPIILNNNNKYRKRV